MTALHRTHEGEVSLRNGTRDGENKHIVSVFTTKTQLVLTPLSIRFVSAFCLIGALFARCTALGDRQ